MTTSVLAGSPQEGLADRIYEASVLPEFWPDVLRGFAQVAECRAAALIATNGESFKWIGCSPLAEELARNHYSYPGGQDRSRRLMAKQRAGFVSDVDVYTQAEMLAEPLYTEYFFPNGFGRGIATAIHVPTGDTIILSAEGDYRLGEFSPAIYNRLDGLRPHLARSALISARLAFERVRTAVETLSGLGLAACAVSRAGIVLVANAEFDAEPLLWTTRGGNRIALLDRRADGLLHEALGLIETEQGVRSMPLVAAGAAPAVLHVVPIRRAAHDLFSRAAAILVLTKASEAPTQATSLLQALFDLSATEADIAARIAAGRTAEQIALADAKSIDTVRNQVKSVLQKTGCRRQLDLARLLAQLIPPGSQGRASAIPSDGGRWPCMIRSSTASTRLPCFRNSGRACSPGFRSSPAPPGPPSLRCVAARPAGPSRCRKPTKIVRAHFDLFANNTRTARLLARPHAGFITDYDNPLAGGKSMSNRCTGIS